jgi:hypothetical protein
MGAFKQFTMPATSSLTSHRQGLHQLGLHQQNNLIKHRCCRNINQDGHTPSDNTTARRHDIDKGIDLSTASTHWHR